MKKEINENVILALIYNKKEKIVKLKSIKIENDLKHSFDIFLKLLKNKNSTFADIIAFLITSKEMNILSKTYSYCIDLNAKYQGVQINIESTIINIVKDLESLSHLQNFELKDFNLNQRKENKKKILFDKVSLWKSVYAIEHTYDICEKKRINQNIRLYSHRKHGWSNPVYSLTDNLKVEIKTNFGYGESSYFYTKLQYKGINITPFSDWVNYRLADYKKLIEYTFKYKVSNESWEAAMLDCIEACNTTLKDEEMFVSKYIITECELMVNGLEEILNNNKFLDKAFNQHYTKSGHELIEFRGAKISGALNFIVQINQFVSILNVEQFIRRIENCNKKLLPHLKIEKSILEKELKKTEGKLVDLENKYTFMTIEAKKFSNKREKLMNLLQKKIFDLNILNSKVKNEFILQNPDFNTFTKKYNSIEKNITTNKSELRKLTRYKEKIDLYIKVITRHF